MKMIRHRPSTLVNTARSLACGPSNFLSTLNAEWHPTISHGEMSTRCSPLEPKDLDKTISPFPPLGSPWAASPKGHLGFVQTPLKTDALKSLAKKAKTGLRVFNSQAERHSWRNRGRSLEYPLQTATVSICCVLARDLGFRTLEPTHYMLKSPRWTPSPL